MYAYIYTHVIYQTYILLAEWDATIPISTENKISSTGSRCRCSSHHLKFFYWKTYGMDQISDQVMSHPQSLAVNNDDNLTGFIKLPINSIFFYEQVTLNEHYCFFRIK